jgi:polar amino acid transport system substrate-binding protein
VRRLLAIFLAAVAAAFVVAGCGSDSSSSAPAATSTTKAVVAGFTTREAGVLTVGTQLPNPPFIVGANKISEISDQGYEVEMVNEIAKRLGGLEVKWVNFPFNGLVAGAPCPCDFAVNGVTIYPDRKEKVDFSAGYFKSNQGILAKKGVTATDLTSAKDLQYGVAQDTSGLFYLENTLKPTKKPRIYPTTVAMFLALRAGQVDAVLSDVPIVQDGAKKNTGASVIGQFETGEDYGAVLKKGSPNTPLLSKVITGMQKDKFIPGLLQKYFPTQVNIPVIK